MMKRLTFSSVDSEDSLEPTSEFPKYKAAIIGCGRIGTDFPDCHAQAYISVPSTHLLCLSDLSYPKLSKSCHRWRRQGYVDYHHIFIIDSPDIVSVCTPPETHARIVKDLCKYKIKAIWLEKPISDNLEDARGILDACREAGVLLQVNHQRRFDPVFIQLKKDIESGKYGKVILSRFHYNRGILNTGSHLFDLLRFLFGDLSPGSVWESQVEGLPNDPNLNGVVFYRSGACTILAQEGTPFELIINGEKQNASFSNDHRISLVPALEHLVECIETGKQSISSGEEAIKSLETIMEFKEKVASRDV